MDEFQTLTIILGVLGFVVHGVIMIVMGTWKLASVKETLAQALADHREQQTTEINDTRAKLYSEVDRLRRETGESILAIRQKVHDIETWSRDTFLRADQFMPVFREFTEKMDERLDKISESIQALQLAQAERPRQPHN